MNIVSTIQDISDELKDLGQGRGVVDISKITQNDSNMIMQLPQPLSLESLDRVKGILVNYI